MSDSKRVFLGLLITLVGIAIFFIPFWYLSTWLVNMSELYKDVEWFGIRGVSQMLGFIPILFATVAVLILLIILMKLTNYFKSKFPNRIISVSGKLNRKDILNTECFDGTCFYSIDDHFMIVQYKDSKIHRTTALIAIIVCLSISIADSINNNNGAMSIAAGILIPLAFCCLLYIFYSIFSPTKKVVFDRMNGKVTLPGFLFLSPATVPFGELTNAYNVYSRLLNISHYKVPFSIRTIPGYGDDDWWSVYVWYMDKNRPLPKGNVFDPYRQRDYDRRKEEGFPEPIYPTFYDIPEWIEIRKKENKEKKKNT